MKINKNKAAFMSKAAAATLGMGILAFSAATFLSPESGLLSHADEEQERQLEELKKEDLEAKLEQANDQKEAQEILRAELEEQVLTLNTSMIELQEKAENTRLEINGKNEEIQKIDEELKTAKEQEQDAYSDMKLRIRYMYENGNTSTWLFSVTSGDFASFLSASEYMSRISLYDKQKRDEYSELVEQINSREQELIRQKEELERLSDEYEKQHSETMNLILRGQANMAICQELIDRYQADLDVIEGNILVRDRLEKEIAESRSIAESESVAESIRESESVQESIRESARIEQSIQESISIAQIEEESRREAEARAASEAASRAAEEEARRVRERETTAPSPTQPPRPIEPGPQGRRYNVPDRYSDVEVDMLAALLWCEAGGESYEAQVGVANVVLNRMNSPFFPNKMEGVLYQRNQFAPVFTGTYIVALTARSASDSCYRAAIDAMNGTNTVGNAMYFKLANKPNDGRGVTIGRIYFY